MKQSGFGNAAFRARLSLLFVILLLLPCSGGSQALPPADIRPLPYGGFVAGIPTEDFEEFAAPEVEGKQRQSNWCWAAGIQMVLNYHGIPVTQENIVAKVFGADINSTAWPAQILAALSGPAVRRDGRPVRISASPIVFSGSDIVQDVAYHWPLIVGLSSQFGGHVYVLTAVTYQVDASNQPIFMTVVLRDPWPASQSRIEVPWGQFSPHVTFVARVRVQEVPSIPN
jgi:hypothetical protein